MPSKYAAALARIFSRRGDGAVRVISSIRYAFRFYGVGISARESVDVIVVNTFGTGSTAMGLKGEVAVSRKEEGCDRLRAAYCARKSLARPSGLPSRFGRGIKKVFRPR